MINKPITIQFCEDGPQIPLPYRTLENLSSFLSYSTYCHEELILEILKLDMPSLNVELSNCMARRDLSVELSDMLWDKLDKVPYRDDRVYDAFLARLNKKQLDEILQRNSSRELDRIAYDCDFSDTSDLRVDIEDFEKLIYKIRNHISPEIRTRFADNHTVPEKYMYTIDECLLLDTLPGHYYHKLKASDIHKVFKLSYTSIREFCSSLHLIKSKAVLKKIAEFLLTHEDQSFAEEAAGTRKTPKFLLELLVQSGNKFVCEIAKRNLSDNY